MSDYVVEILSERTTWDFSEQELQVRTEDGEVLIESRIRQIPLRVAEERDRWEKRTAEWVIDQLELDTTVEDLLDGNIRFVIE